MKDEIHNIKPLLESVAGCFDHIYLTDTGSTDGTIEFAKSEEATRIAEAPITVKHFTWIDDFAAARNHSMEGVTEDYVMWLDLDDSLSDKEQFKMWRDNVMLLSDFWLAPYNYAFDKNGNPVCTFLRERVIKTSKKFSWKYFIHEGMIADEEVKANLVSNWTVQHRRSEEDYKKDFRRNVSMLEKKARAEDGTITLPPRLQWYYGKELHDKGMYQEAYVWLDGVCDSPALELHDRILCFEYLVRCCLQRFHAEQNHKPMHERDLRLVAKGQQLALQGIVLAPMRAEFYCLAGDCLVQQGKEVEALPMYTAASSCIKPSNQGFIFINHEAYSHVPRNAIAMIKFKLGDLDGAIFEAQACFKKFNHQSTQDILTQFLNLKNQIANHAETEKVETDDIVFSCLPGGHPYPFDEEIYETKGVGGSETALIEVARHIKELTGRRVLVFNTRESRKECISGVEYRPAQEIYEYFTKFKPDLHIAWRHNVKLTDAKTFLWSHDLTTQGAEMHSNYDKILCLSKFHESYVQIQQRIPKDKIHITRNGVNNGRFMRINNAGKDSNKIIWPSSPDRGLKEAIFIVEKARRMSLKDLELHVYYGMENLYKYGLGKLGDELKALFQQHDWIHYHGNVDQKTLAREMEEAAIWLYPADFIETYCITAVEAAMAGCYSIVREVGALRDTLKPFVEEGWAELIFSEAKTEKEQHLWAERLVSAINLKLWEKVDARNMDYSWEGVAKDFLELADLPITKTWSKAVIGESPEHSTV